jgi:hypothetical protein
MKTKAKLVRKRKKHSHKKRFKEMEVTRIHLNPEQAVLSCCDATSHLAMNRRATRVQCDGAGGCARLGDEPHVDIGQLVLLCFW